MEYTMINTDWELPLFAIGDYKLCLFSYLCPPCALAHAKSNLDDSNVIFNACCVTIPATRWLVRTAYGIHGDAMDDAATSLACFPCVINQLLHTTTLRKNPSPNDSGMLQNYQKWEVPYNKVMFQLNTDFLYACMCHPCVVGTVLEEAVGMPFWFGMLCVAFPWTARNIVRYQYRIDGDDFVEDCAIPTSLCLLSFIALNICPYTLPCIFPYPAAVMGAQLMAESETRGPSMHPFYLAKSKPPKSEVVGLLPTGTYGARDDII